MKASVIVSVYNWLDALKVVLAALACQDTQDFEIIVADDGSVPEVGAYVQEVAAQMPVPVLHVWHEDAGFRRSRINNLAVAKASGDYLILMDGDCVARPDFVSSHMRLARQGYFTAGNRVLLSESFTAQVFDQHLPIHRWSFFRWLRLCWCGGVNRVWPLLKLPLGPLRYCHARDWRRARGCNIGVWRSDYIAVNGFEEAFTGWGYEDSDFIIRLIRAGVLRQSGRFAVPVVHLWHRLADRSREAENRRRLDEIAASDRLLAEEGVSCHL